MATISPVFAFDAVTGGGKVTWTGVSTADTMEAYGPIKGAGGQFASVQLSSVAWGGSTVVLQVSNDNVTFVTLKDRNGNNISANANNWFEISTAGLYLKPASSGGTADNVDVVVSLRGV